MPGLPDEKFLDLVADRLAALPTVRAVTSAAPGPRAPTGPTATGTWPSTTEAPSTRPASAPSAGRVSGVGDWGGGVFNGGAWLTVDGRRVDVHYRDLDVVEHELTEAGAGRFRVEPLMFHLAGIRRTLSSSRVPAHVPGYTSYRVPARRSGPPRPGPASRYGRRGGPARGTARPGPPAPRPGVVR
ncbi:hypothetical protein SFUMM280S_02514 [Streptomyces fumanus]